jgi:hypothetical protein
MGCPLAESGTDYAPGEGSFIGLPVLDSCVHGLTCSIYYQREHAWLDLLHAITFSRYGPPRVIFTSYRWWSVQSWNCEFVLFSPKIETYSRGSMDIMAFDFNPHSNVSNLSCIVIFAARIVSLTVDLCHQFALKCRYEACYDFLSGVCDSCYSGLASFLPQRTYLFDSQFWLVKERSPHTKSRRAWLSEAGAVVLLQNKNGPRRSADSAFISDLSGALQAATRE